MATRTPAPSATWTPWVPVPASAVAVGDRVQHPKRSDWTYEVAAVEHGASGLVVLALTATYPYGADRRLSFGPDEQVTRKAAGR